VLMSVAGTISYTFRWPYAASQVAVGGQFNNWTEAKAIKEGNEFQIKIDGLKPNSKYLYKYIIDGVWKEDETAPTDNSEVVNGRAVINNVLVTGSSSLEDRLLQTEKERDALFRQVKKLEIESKNQKSNGGNSQRVHELETQLAEQKKLTEENTDTFNKLKELNAQLIGRSQHQSAEHNLEILRISDAHRTEIADAQAKLRGELDVERFNTEKQHQRAVEAERKLAEAKEALSKAPATAAPVSRQNPDSTSYTFRWVYGGKSVSLGGDFNNWQVEPMNKEGNDHVLVVHDLQPEKKYAFRYYVDGHWAEDEDAPSEALKVEGQVVAANYIYTGPASIEGQLSRLQSERDSLARSLKRVSDSLEIAQQRHSKCKTSSSTQITVNSYRDVYNTHVLELFAFFSFLLVVLHVTVATLKFLVRRVKSRAHGVLALGVGLLGTTTQRKKTSVKGKNQ